MDLHSALRLDGTRWKLARLGAFLCFALACGLLVVSLASPSRAAIGPQPKMNVTAAR